MCDCDDSQYSSHLPKSKNVSQFQEGRVYEDGKGILLKEFGKEDHGFTLFPQLARPQTFVEVKKAMNNDLCVTLMAAVSTMTRIDLNILLYRLHRIKQLHHLLTGDA